MTDDPTSNYRGYAVSDAKGVIHVDPTTNKLHRDDHICNQQCHDLKARAQAEYLEDVRRTGGYLDKTVPTTDDIVAPGGWVVPSAKVLAEWEQNRQDLEGIGLEDDISKEPERKVLYEDEVPLIVSLMMDRLGIKEFQFTSQELINVDGKITLDTVDDPSMSGFIIRRFP